MYLKKIKISGFKSFVDTTNLHFPHDMTAVVGPNGCGKSNIIDAVRWVLGESSAKHLRGDAMADVIFNGSVSRSPVSRASVELLFDNSQQRVDHALLQYNEISIRRELFRDGTNQYYLNGKKCRRKDVTELFLGTGLGPRSYAIIEQGMISRLIESKPYELRNFIEEAAGISKYKEKRRETEQRIKQTRDNLNRLADIRIELGTQLDKLKEQSVVAQQFRALKQRQRETKSRLCLVQIYDVERAINQLTKQKLTLVNEQDRLAAAATKRQTQLTTIDVQQNELSTVIDTLQQEFYLHGTELTKLEQKILHHKARKHESAGRHKEYQEQSIKLQSMLQAEQEQLLLHKTGLENNESEYLALQTELQIIDQALALAKVTSEQAISQQAVYSAKKQRFTAKLDVLTKAHQGAQSLLDKTQQQRLQIDNEQSQLASHNKQAEITAKVKLQQTLQQEKLMLTDNLADLQKALQGFQQHLDGVKEQIASCVTEQTELKASLCVLSELSLNAEHTSQAQAWLESNFENIPLKLLQQLDVTPGWEAAVEKVLANWLDAYCIAEVDLAQFTLTELPALQWIHQSQSAVRVGSLAEKVQNNVFNRQLNQIICVEDSAQAQAACKLNGDYSYITPQGDWFTDEGVWLSAQSNEIKLKPQGRVAMHQQQSLQQQRLAEVELQLAELQEMLIDSIEKTTYSQSQVDEIKVTLQSKQAGSEKVDIELELLQQQQHQWQVNTEQLQARLATLESTLLTEVEQVNSFALQIKNTSEAIASLANDDELVLKAEEAKADKAKFMQQQQMLASQVQQLLLLKTKFCVEVEKQQQLIVKTESQYQNLLSDMAALDTGSMQEGRLQQFEVDLSILAEKQLAVENNKTKKQTELAKLANSKREVAEKHGKIVTSLLKVKDKIQQLELKQANNKAKEQLLYQQIVDDNVDINTLKRECVNILTLKEYQHILVKLDGELQQIGAVNLAAVEEFEQQSQRKLYLDEQTQDLESAIETLEAAIVKIDKQTRARFATTFDKINNDFKLLFPKVFGGGAAWLELTSANLLDAGVTIMARPPGKKNARISLLSGGEKALTALSLVFAIFRLNPAPFCMLDEVDAPLDELNVTRFCNLVREMSETVQFIYISHNKLAMEMAEQLIGVTMHEPGVSRIVAVDISTAMELTDK